MDPVPGGQGDEAGIGEQFMDATLVRLLHMVGFFPLMKSEGVLLSLSVGIPTSSMSSASRCRIPYS